MNKLIRVLLTGSMLLGTVLVAAADDQVRANVPFDFSVNGTVLKAGTYTISRASENNPSVMVIRGAQGQQAEFLVGGLTPAKPGSSLSFNRYGDSYFLTKITNGQGKYNLPVTRQERIAVNHPGNEMTTGSK